MAEATRYGECVLPEAGTDPLAERGGDRNGQCHTSILRSSENRRRVSMSSAPGGRDPKCAMWLRMSLTRDSWLMNRSRSTPCRPSTCQFAAVAAIEAGLLRSEEHTSELQSRENLVCRLLLE